MKISGLFSRTSNQPQQPGKTYNSLYAQSLGLNSVFVIVNLLLIF
jgi:hypothetical protein